MKKVPLQTLQTDPEPYPVNLSGPLPLSPLQSFPDCVTTTERKCISNPDTLVNLEQLWERLGYVLTRTSIAHPQQTKVKALYVRCQLLACYNNLSTFFQVNTVCSLLTMYTDSVASWKHGVTTAAYLPDHQRACQSCYPPKVSCPQLAHLLLQQLVPMWRDLRSNR